MVVNNIMGNSKRSQFIMDKITYSTTVDKEKKRLGLVFSRIAQSIWMVDVSPRQGKLATDGDLRFLVPEKRHCPTRQAQGP